MKNKKFPKWLLRLPVLLVALIMLITSLSMAVPSFAVDASVPDVPVYDGYAFAYWDYNPEGPPIAVMVNVDSPLIHEDFDCAYVIGSELTMFFQSLSLEVESDALHVTVLAASLYSVTVTSVSFGSYLLYLLDPIGDNLWSRDYTLIPLDGSTVVANKNVLYDGVYSPFYVWQLPPEPVSPDSILSVFTGVGSWFSGAVQNISTMFWTAESGMTVLGYLAVASLALAVVLLIFYLIAGWLKFH